MLNKLQAVRTSQNYMAFLCLLAVCILWGTTWVASTYSVRQGVPALQVVALRQIVSGLLLFLIFVVIMKRTSNWPQAKDTIVLSILNFIFSNGLSTWGVQYLPAGLGAIIGAMYPLWLVLLYYFFYNKSISKWVWIGMIISFAGLLVIFMPMVWGAELQDLFLFGLGLSIFSSFTWAVGNIYIKKQNEKNIDPYVSLSFQMLLSGIVIYAISNSTLPVMSLSRIPSKVWVGILYLSIVGSVIAYSCFLYAMKHLPAEQVSIYAYVNPIVALFLSNIFMGEKITINIIFGTLIALLGLYILNKAFSKLR